MNKAIIVGVSTILLSGVSWAGETDCGTFPRDSIARSECEHVQREVARQSGPQNSPVNLGVVSNTGHTQTPQEFIGAPLRFSGEQVSISPLRFRDFTGNGVAVFVTPAGKDIVVGDIPGENQFLPGRWYSVTVVPRSITRGTNAYGAPVTAPSAYFISAYQVH